MPKHTPVPDTGPTSDTEICVRYKALVPYTEAVSDIAASDTAVLMSDTTV